MKNKPMTYLIIVAATLSTSLAAGLFYAYSCSVNPGLGRLADADYLKAMQSINRAILNPVFFATFLGTVILLPLATWLSYEPQPSKQFWYFLAAALLYIVGVFGVTIAGNVPLNDALDKINIPASTAEQLSQHRQAFEARWSMFHTIRTVANVLSALLAILGCLAKR